MTSSRPGGPPAWPPAGPPYGPPPGLPAGPPPHHARPPARRSSRRAPSRRGSRTATALTVLVFGGLSAVAVLGFVAVVGAFVTYAAGLPDPRDLERVPPAQESIIYARDGTTELARFSGAERRELVTWDEIPAHLADATTAVEDKTFWTNTGFDPLGILAAALDSLTGDARGGSTITQQLVRQRLLPAELVQTPGRLAERKVKEIIQSVRATQAYRGPAGKERILTAYLNQNFYGSNSYGVKTAARTYFGIDDLSELSLAQAAILAALPQSPSAYDLVRNAIETEDGRLVVPADSPIVQRRDYILGLLARDAPRRALSGARYGTQDYLDAMREEVELRPQGLPRWRAPHFVWYVQDELARMLCGEEETCTALEQGGLRVITTLDWEVQKVAEKWVQASALVPHRSDPVAAARALGVPYADWMRALRSENVWNGALSAIDYQTGEIIAYVGSANYYESRKVNKRFQPQFDVLRDGWRQPGSSFKPITYATGIDDRSLTAATMLMDVTTDFGGGYTPTNYDALERGPVRVRNALQFSLNIPAVKALDIVGQGRVWERAQDFGLTFQTRRPRAGLSMALGTTEVHPLDLTTAYATLANRGRHVGHTPILRVQDRAGRDVVPPYETPRGREAVSPQAAHVVTDILAGNTVPSINPVWGSAELTDRRGRHRPAALKTGTSNDARDLNAYGYIAPPAEGGRRRGEYALAVGVWNGNSDASPVSVTRPVFSLDVSARVWDAFMSEVTGRWAINDFRRPGGLTDERVDAFTGFRPSRWSRRQETELFLEGTEPQRDPYLAGLEVVTAADGKEYRWAEGCEGEPRERGFLTLEDAEADHPSWNRAVRGWIARARRGTGVAGNVAGDRRTYTAYFFASWFQPYGASWGGPLPPTRSCRNAPAASPSDSPSASPSALPTEPGEPTPEPTEGPGEPTAEPTAKPPRTPRPTREPTPEPTEGPGEPSPEPTPAETPGDADGVGRDG